MPVSDPSLPPYPDRPKVHAKWRGRWHKAIWQHTPQALRIPGHVLDWVVRACDGYDGPPDRTQRTGQHGHLAIRDTKPREGTFCRRCYA